MSSECLECGTTHAIRENWPLPPIPGLLPALLRSTPSVVTIRPRPGGSCCARYPAEHLDRRRIVVHEQRRRPRTGHLLQEWVRHRNPRPVARQARDNDVQADLAAAFEQSPQWRRCGLLADHTVRPQLLLVVDQQKMAWPLPCAAVQQLLLAQARGGRRPRMLSAKPAMTSSMSSAVYA